MQDGVEHKITASVELRFVVMLMIITMMVLIASSRNAVAQLKFASEVRSGDTLVTEILKDIAGACKRLMSLCWWWCSSCSRFGRPGDEADAAHSISRRSLTARAPRETGSKADWRILNEHQLVADPTRPNKTYCNSVSSRRDCRQLT